MAWWHWALLWFVGAFIFSCLVFYFDETATKDDDSIAGTLAGSAFWPVVAPILAIVFIMHSVADAGKNRRKKIRVAQKKQLALDEEKARIEKEAEAEVARILSEQEVEERRGRVQKE